GARLGGSGRRSGVRREYFHLSNANMHGVSLRKRSRCTKWRLPAPWQGVIPLVYLALLLGGGIGIVLMAILGFAHGPGHGQTGPGGSGESLLLQVMPFLSPLNWFSWMVGGGAIGAASSLLLHLGEPWAAGTAVVGAAAFDYGILKPIWRLVFSFASKPAGNLE